MSIEENKAIVWRFYEELWNSRKLNVADEIFAPDCVTHQLHSGEVSIGAPRGPEAVKHHVSEWLATFPDLRFVVEQIIAEGDRVVSHCVMRGTHQAAWFGIAPTGKEIEIRLIVTHRIVKRKIVEDWVLVETLGFFQQLLLLPKTEEILAKAGK